jgi:hypothetical protein
MTSKRRMDRDLRSRVDRAPFFGPPGGQTRWTIFRGPRHGFSIDRLPQAFGYCPVTATAANDLSVVLDRTPADAEVISSFGISGRFAGGRFIYLLTYANSKHDWSATSPDSVRCGPDHRLRVCSERGERARERASGYSLSP